MGTTETFKIHKIGTDDMSSNLRKYPVIVIKKRISKNELNSLIDYLRENEHALIDATKHLPAEPVKRVDIDITKLAIGLWIYRNESMGNNKMENWIQEKYKKNENYFGVHVGFGKDSFPSYKSDAIKYLKVLYP